MAQFTKIGWCDHTANLWHGCTEVHAGCDHCYARILSQRWGRDIWGDNKPRMEIKSVWDDLAKYQRLAAAEGKIKTVFMGSMMDIFEKPMPVVDMKGNIVYVDHGNLFPLNTGLLREEFFNDIDAGKYPNLLFLFLTKRPSNINKYIPEHWKLNPPKNVMFGTSPVDQRTADRLIPQLLKVKGKHFLSCEPLLGSIHLRTEWLKYIHWVICGGESGTKLSIRPMHIDWPMHLRHQCKDAGIPFFFKQWGEYIYYVTNPITFSIPLAHMGKARLWWDGEKFNIGKNVPVEKSLKYGIACKVGTNETGNTLDGVIYEEFPEWDKFMN